MKKIVIIFLLSIIPLTLNSKSIVFEIIPNNEIYIDCDNTTKIIKIQYNNINNFLIDKIELNGKNTSATLFVNEQEFTGQYNVKHKYAFFESTMPIKINNDSVCSIEFYYYQNIVKYFIICHPNQIDENIKIIKEYAYSGTYKEK